MLLNEKQLRETKYPVSFGQIRKLRITGGGPPFIKIGRNVFYDERAVDEWLAAHTMNSTSDKRHPSRSEQ